MKKRFSKFFGTRQFYKLALAVAVPLMMQQLITSSVNLVDNLMVGQLGDAALGGVAAVNRFYIIATYGTNGVLAAAAIFIAQFFGAVSYTHLDHRGVGRHGGRCQFTFGPALRRRPDGGGKPGWPAQIGRAHV